jgi:2-keto-4-pentenoate hydratase/2-oxohepta-3-ene-1,7-dioic acid hydratase (catechol pathway)
MKFYTFELQTPLGITRRVGVEDKGKLVDANFVIAYYLYREGFSNPYEIANSIAPPDMISFLQAGEKAIEFLKRAIIDYPEKGERGERISYNFYEVKLLSPIPRPWRIHDFMAIEEHVKNVMKRIPEEWYNIPVAYKGNPDAVIGPDDEVIWPRYTEKLDYELELCAIIGKKGRNVELKRAEEYIFGYSIFNDFSARDIQMREMSVGLGPFKGKDFATAIGPCIVTRDSFNPYNAKMIARVNGEVWSEGYIREMKFDFPYLVHYLSLEEDIFPGDVIGSGTVGKGCGLEINKWLKPGDIVELEVEGIGVLRNKVVRYK